MPIWNIPYPRNPVFTGRKEILERICTQLQAGQAAALSQAQAISGLGGIGKTQIAVEFAYRHRSDYEAVLWVLADTRESLVSGYIAIAGLLKLPEKEAKEQEITIEAVRIWLQTHGSWLLILHGNEAIGQVMGVGVWRFSWPIVRPSAGRGRRAGWRRRVPWPGR